MRRLFDCCEEFSKVLELITNQAKSNIHFGGVTEAYQQAILQYTNFKKGTTFQISSGISELKKLVYKLMPTIDREDVRKYSKLDCQIRIICWQITTCPERVVSNSKLLVTNFLFTKESTEASRNSLQKILMEW